MFLELFAGRTDWGMGGWGDGVLGLTDRVTAVRPEFPAPCGCGLWLWAAGIGAAAKKRTSSDYLSQCSTFPPTLEVSLVLFTFSSNDERSASKGYTIDNYT